MTFTFRAVFLVTTCFVIAVSALGAHTLTSHEQKVLAAWLAQHPTFRAATDADCKCDEDIRNMKVGYGDKWTAVPDYHPYVATGDFNGDGVADFAVIVIDSSKSTKNFELLVFDGPFGPQTKPVFVQPDLEGDALFFGPPRPKPYRLVIGPFESDNTAILVPHGRTYTLEGNDSE